MNLMSEFNWDEINPNDVIKAIRIFDSDNQKYPEARSTFLIFEGRKYPAKHIRGIAYQVHFGAEISKENFSGGKETVKFFSRLGFEIQYTPSIKNKKSPVIKSKKLKKKSLSDDIKASDDSLKITIPSKGVIEQKNALQLLLNKLYDGDIICEKTYPWMKSPEEISGEYKSICDALVAYRGNKDFIKKNVKLRCDFVCESHKLIIEYDERQHFSEARKIALQAYPKIPLCFDKDLWIRACADICARDNQPINRDEIRAFYDSTRDIEAFKNGYRLVRIMHGQIDFESDDAMEKLKSLLEVDSENSIISPKIENGQNSVSIKRNGLKIGLYLQSDELFANRKEFDKAMNVVRSSDIDILVLPEFSFVPFDEEFRNADYLNDNDINNLYQKALDLSRDIGRAIVICNKDRFGTIMSIYANALASDTETLYKDYIKHTMTEFSAFEIENYQELAEYFFEPIILKGYRIGLTICYDCNHSLFSRKYGINGIDIILNSTGGNVDYNKWFKYNKVRAIENKCFTFSTMGYELPNNYVYGFTPSGKEMHPVLLNGTDNNKHNFLGGIYVYDTAADDRKCETDSSFNQDEKTNKNSDIYIPINDIDEFINKGKYIAEGIRVLKSKEQNIVMCLVNDDDIMKPEKVLKLLYAKELKDIKNKRYIIINQWNTVDEDFYKTQLSVVLKVRSMENFCAVILAANNMAKCFQCGNVRSAQVVKSENGKFGIDLSRTGGPETIWRNKSDGMTKASWRENVEWLIESL